MIHFGINIIYIYGIVLVSVNLQIVHHLKHITNNNPVYVLLMFLVVMYMYGYIRKYVIQVHLHQEVHQVYILVIVKKKIVQLFIYLNQVK